MREQMTSGGLTHEILPSQAWTIPPALKFLPVVPCLCLVRTDYTCDGVSAACPGEYAPHWGVRRGPLLVCAVLFFPRPGRALYCRRADPRTQQEISRFGDVASLGVNTGVRAYCASDLGISAEVRVLLGIDLCPVVGADKGRTGLPAQCVAAASIYPTGSATAGVVAVVVDGVSAFICW